MASAKCSRFTVSEHLFLHFAKIDFPGLAYFMAFMGVAMSGLSQTHLSTSS